MRREDLNGALADFRRLEDVRELPQDDRFRIREQTRLISRFYDLVTTFYEFGWGQAFHFSPRRPRESFRASQRRHHEEIANLLRLRPEMEVADIGSGVGGPLVDIAQASGAAITGINFNAHQIRRGEFHVQRAGLGGTCRFLYADFMNVPLDDGTFDALYSFEAITHAPNRRLAYQELYRLLKPGGEAAIVDWCLTDLYDGSNGRHNDIRERIERTNATSELPITSEYVGAVQGAGFEILRALDQQAEQGNPATPWYMALQARDVSFTSFARTPWGRAATALATRMLERLHLAPAGTSETARFLNVAADALVEGGELGIFTPSFLVHARKPR